VKPRFSACFIRLGIRFDSDRISLLDRGGVRAFERYNELFLASMRQPKWKEVVFQFLLSKHPLPGNHNQKRCGIASLPASSTAGTLLIGVHSMMQAGLE
jgi:hypothetical protein